MNKQLFLLAIGFFLILAVLAVVFAILRAIFPVAHNEKNVQNNSMNETPSLRRATVTIRGVQFAVDVADTTSSRTQGLSGRPSLGEHEGMLFVFPFKSPQVFWMKDMNFPIDIFWVKNGAVTGVAENAQPEPGKSIFMLKLYSSPGLVDRVLEVPAGTKTKLGIEVGDAVTVVQQ